ncbi:MAG: LytS/YhcK type 5TM receptor domain-containing protein [Bacillota bacterium]
MQVILSLIYSTSVIGMVAYLFCRSRYFQERLAQPGPWSRLPLALFFGGLSIMGTFMGVPVHGALGNMRSVGATVGGLFGGPLVGIGAGVIGGGHRLLRGGFTCVPCGLGTLVAGCVGSVFYRRNRGRPPTVSQAALASFLAESVQRVLVLLLARPFDLAVQLELTVGPPMLILNPVAAALFVLIVEDMRRRLDADVSKRVQGALSLARSAVVPLVREGLSEENCLPMVRELRRATGAMGAALVTKQGALLAAAWAERMSAGFVLWLTGAVEGMLARADGIGPVRQRLSVPAAHRVRGVPAEVDVVASPILMAGDCSVAGWVVLVPSGQVSRILADQVSAGLAELLAQQLHVAALERQAALAAEARLQALQAQVNPHFLFNSLSAIIGLCRTDAARARDLLLHLSDFLHATLRRKSCFATVDEEIETVMNYVTIEKARMGERLRVDVNVDDEARTVLLPAFTIQPLVENAIKHGLFPKPAGGSVRLTVRVRGDCVEVTVTDDGVGMSGERLQAVLGCLQSGDGEGTGIHRVHARLHGLYGDRYSLSMQSEEGRGTCVRIRIPGNGVADGRGWNTGR